MDLKFILLPLIISNVGSKNSATLDIYIYMIRIKIECFFGVRHKPFPIDLMITRFQQLDQPVGGFKDADKIMIPSTTMIFLGVLAPHKMATAKDVIQ